MRRINTQSILVGVAVAATSTLLATALVSNALEAHNHLSLAPESGFEEIALTPAANSAYPPSNRFHYGHWHLAGVSLRDLVRAAYASEGVFVDGQVIGGPRWVDTERYDVHATMPPSLAGDPDPAPLRFMMLQRFLADRFAIAVRRDTKELSVFDLVRVDDGPFASGLVPLGCQHQANDIEHCPPTRFAAGAMAEGVSMSDVAAALSAMPEIGRVVRDRTRLAGSFDVQLHWSGGSLAGSAANGLYRSTETLRGGLPLKAALRAQLGLTLASADGHVNVVRIERAERPWLDDPFAPHHSHD